MDSTPDAYAEHVKNVRARVEAEERAAVAERPVTCNADLDWDVAEALRGLIADNLARYAVRTQGLLRRADNQLARAIESSR